MNPRTPRTNGAQVDVQTASGPQGEGSTQPTVLHIYRRPQWVLARFVARRTARSAILWGAVFGLYVYASTVGFIDLAPTPAGRQPFLAALAGNTGLKAMFGVPYRIDTVGGFVTWRATGVMSLGGALWGLLVATRVTRGEEAAGRWEPFLAGRTTHRRAAAQALAGLACALLLMLAIAAAATTAAAATIAVGTRSDLGFGLGPSLLFALAITAGAAGFIVVGTLAAQIMPIRARAASLAAGVFGVAFLLRAIADIAPHAHWLVYLSPLGWVEQVRALSDPQPIWLLPIGAFAAAGAAGTIWLAGRRDLGASTWADKDATGLSI
jgi:ABC-2 type transport system permease protein